MACHSIQKPSGHLILKEKLSFKIIQFQKRIEKSFFLSFMCCANTCFGTLKQLFWHYGIIFRIKDCNKIDTTFLQEALLQKKVAFALNLTSTKRELRGKQ